MKRWIFAVAIAAVASIIVAGTASADVQRQGPQTATFTATTATLTLNNGNVINATHGTAVPVNISLSPTAAKGNAALLVDVGPGTTTGKPIDFLAYPYGDYDRRVRESVGKAGYEAALTCEYGRVKRGSDPMRMKRVAIEKSMDFALFRHLLGAGNLRLEEMSPQPGRIIDDPNAMITVAAKIPNFKSVDPKSVGMALMSVGSSFPFTYDPQTGSISLTIKEALKGTFQRALVWATDLKSGKRIEASWTFRLPDEQLPIRPAVDPRMIAPASMTRPLTASAGTQR